MPQKNYATSSSNNNACFFKKDYSYYVNHECLGCKFCYNRLAPRPRPKYRAAGLLDIEITYNDSVKIVPVTVSRFCDPLFSETSKNNSIMFMTKVLGMGGQIIFRSAISEIPDGIYKLAEEYKDNFMYQGRIFLPENNICNIIKDDLAPKFSALSKIIECVNIFNGFGNDVALFLDPFIIGITDTYINEILHKMHESNISKLVVRQLFATPFFKEYLKSVSRTMSIYLDQKVGEYWTYDSAILFDKIAAILEYITENKLNIDIAICNNRQIGKIINTQNCCMYSNAKAIVVPEMTKGPRFNEIKELR